MCEPTTIALTLAAVGAATAAAEVVSDIKQAKAENRAISEQYAAVTEEVKDNQAGEINDRLRAARREQGKIKVAAGEGGLQLGGSVAGLLQDSVMQTALYDERVRQNAGNRIDAASAEANSMYSRVQSPTVIGAGLRIANGGVKGYATGQGIALSRQKAGT